MLSIFSKNYKVKGFDENSNELNWAELKEEKTDLFVSRCYSHILKPEVSSEIGSELVSEFEAARFIEGTEVLARWSDGLFYLAIILEIDEVNEKCFVKFEDSSEFWVLFQHIQEAHMQGSEILCAVCENGESEPPNEIVLCDHCGLGYHQQCHNPTIGEDVLQPEVMWNCRGCVFATTAKKGGAIKVGPNAEAMQEMKKSLPYDLSNLEWNTNHETNTTQCYCYCGGPGEWYVKMIQCSECRQWFHEACIQCLEMPMLYGDQFYLFICSVCNCGPEYIRRLELDWVDVAHLVVFNLTILHNRKYHEFDSAIIPFVNGNWELLQMPKQYLKITNIQRKRNLLQALQNNQNRFKCGREVKKKMSLWSLRVRVPPPAPKNQANGIMHSQSDSGIKVSKKKSKLLSSIKQNRSSDSSVCTTPEKRVIRKSVSVPDNSLKKFSYFEHEDKILKHPSTSVKEENHSHKRKRGRPCGSKNKKGTKALKTIAVHQKFQNFSITKKRARRLVLNDSTDDDNSSRGTLDSIIPPPNNFNGSNNPFCSYEIHQHKQGLSLFKNVRPIKRKLNCEDLCVKNGVVKLKRKCNKTSKSRFSSDVSRSNETSENSCDISHSEHDSHSSVNNSFVSEGVPTSDFSYDDLRSSVNSYFGASNRIANGENFSILAKRITVDGKTQYLIQWENASIA